MIRPAALFMFALRLVLVVVLATTFAIVVAVRRLVLVGIVALFLELAARILIRLLTVRTGDRCVRMRGHGVLAAPGPTASIRRGID